MDFSTLRVPRPSFKATARNAVWTPWASEYSAEDSVMEQEAPENACQETENENNQDLEERPQYRPVKFSPVPPLGSFKKSEASGSQSSSSITTTSSSSTKSESQQNHHESVSKSEYAKQDLSQESKESNLKHSPQIIGTSAPSVSSPGTSPPEFTRLGGSRLPLPQSPTITLLQKAREGQIPRGAAYLNHNSKDPYIYDEKITVDGDKIHTDTYYAMPIEEGHASSNVTIKAPSKYDFIGPTEYGIPVGLRTNRQRQNVKDEYASDWYKTMFKRLHKYENKGKQFHNDGYMSEPDFRKDDRPMFGGKRGPRKLFAEEASQSPSGDAFKIQPRSIAEYEPGRSSIADREAKIGTRYMPTLDVPKTKYVYSDGYDSDSTLIRKTGRMNTLDPIQQRAWYRAIQRGEDIPLEGLGKPAPEKPKEPVIGPYPPVPSNSEDYAVPQHKYQESEVNIHYRSPVHTMEKEYIEEDELRRRQEEAMKRFYEEEYYKKQLQQIAEIEMRRHNDFFVPSQKSPIPLDRYENSFEAAPPVPKIRTPEPRTLAKVLFNFTAQSARELELKKGDLVYINRKIDKNWYEGEHHGLNGIFPTNYVEIIPPENAKLQPRKAMEGLARAKFNFRAQTPVELSFFKGESLVLTRRVDANWYEGRIGNKKGIFPVSYVHVLTEPQEIHITSVSPKPPASPVYSPLVNGSLRSSNQPSYQSSSLSHSKEVRQPVNQSLHIDINSDPIPYRALYHYFPQNEDELELFEGDTVYVMEKCDDGWYVGTSLKTGLFGTFPGNYVERI